MSPCGQCLCTTGEVKMSLSKFTTCKSSIRKLLSDKLHAKANENTWFEDLVLLLNSDGIYNQRLCNMTVSGSTLKWLVVMKRSMPNQSDPTAVQLKICSDRSYNFQVYNANQET